MDVLLGLQWGDEGKGKIVDVLAPSYDIVARFQGGPNAGHTLVFDGIKHVLHQIPSGIFRVETLNVVGNGVVVCPIKLKIEIEALQARQVDVISNLVLSKRTQIILPTHRALDAAYEQAKGSAKIGSTLKGIGPAYQDKYGRNGFRVGDLLRADFKARYNSLKTAHLKILEFLGVSPDLDAEEAEFMAAVEFIKQLKMADTEILLNKALQDDQKLLAEGAQGSLLDIDFGSYPYVTSSSTCIAGACSGLGVPPSRVERVFGIFKAYCTRVGSGPFPTELEDETGDLMRKQGHEFGATTGRSRRCGWLDLVALRYAVMLNGVTSLFMMKADVLSVFDEINVCVAYQLADGSITTDMPYEITSEEPLKPIYAKFKGWGELPNHISWNQNMPEQLEAYIKFIEKETGVPIGMLSYGPDRSQTAFNHAVLAL
ncbi:MAG: adenylosuccinate synthase [Cytophagales bacterium]|nr:MAG: adenylosuccinate synthase [Cytophagales bacterium]TAF60607.1 MAG: adenylosuccinate synthase [Cytophagales bacterium]